MGIVEFLEARIAEDEAVAKAARPGPWFHDSNLTCGPRVPPDDFLMVPEDPSDTISPCNDKIPDQDSRHIARHDPARILREVAAKRAVVVEHKLVPAKNVWGNSTGGFGCELCDSTPDLDLGGIEIERSNGCKTLRTLAVIFSDHPDFSEGWRP